MAIAVNPSDLLHIRGEYGSTRVARVRRARGFGVVDRTGPGLLQHLRGLKPGVAR
jgi:hypothetical protein